MTKDRIRELALANGFTLREQPDGTMDLNPYVYDFAAAICMQCAEAAGEVDPEQLLAEAWMLGAYVADPCPNCGRQRLCRCDNGKHRCEKCNWSPELNDYAPVWPA